jgi:branched-chain amino acid transport system ATP-binding protein
MAEAALSGTGLAKSFGGIVAVSGVDLVVGQGEVVGVLGPNGSGKTTLLSMLAGLVRPDRGHVRAVGQDVTRAAPFSPKRRNVACTLQTPRVFSSMTVRDNLELALYAKRCHGSAVDARARIDDLLERLGLASAANVRSGALSGGQRKLVDLARALIVRPAVLLADEPTAGVSHLGKDLMTAALRHAADGGTAVVLVSHDLPWTFELCRRITFLRGGEVLVEGIAEDVRLDERIADAYLR